MSYNEWSGVLGLIGSILVAIPAIEVSYRLKKIHQLENPPKGLHSGDGDPSQHIADKLKHYTGMWNSRRHIMLSSGFLVLVLSFIISIMQPGQ